ncbi:integrase catalytic domain-containing protein [Trichonephila clavata]|uniref:Integrase catalytic domain-containing protein n=1 Tax=Trichonephila clavata TaxID=2740835 RepID=A0A8X6L1D9_TRICU|nr:integrase catalytic domain-containing protein [Trichonephila clavata]
MVTLTLQNMELPKIWDLEVLDIKDPVERKNKTLLEEETLILFKKTIKVGEDRRHCRVVFGVTSSQVLLNASIRHHLNSTEFQLESLQQTIEKLKKGFYVDNLTISVENQEELVKFKTQTMEIMKAATFELRCWAHTGVQDQERYACCAFLRCVEEDEVKVSLVSAKARVFPDQRPTIPQLELLGATIGARIASTILETLNSPLKTFVPGDLNPADLPSRSCDWSQLFRSQWWEGPKWLHESPECWPYTEITLPQEALLERRKSVAVNLTIDTNDNFGNRFLYFSSYPKIIRMTAWVLRFCHNLKANSHKLRKELTFQEIQMAEEAAIRIIQVEWSSKIQEKYSKTIQFYEKNKILKVRSRLILGEDAEDFVRPTVLPDHPIVRRLKEYTHKTLQHAGVQTTLSHIRKDNIERVVRLRVANGEIIRPIQRIYPLEINSAEFTKSVPEKVESATETIDDVDHEHIPPEEQSETHRIEQPQSVKKTRFVVDVLFL